MLQAFFDASRTKVQAGAYVIGGYVGPESLWTPFVDEWRANLAYWGVQDFHLTECLAKRGDFAKLDTHKSELCALSFGQIIHQRRPDAIWSGVLDEEWDELDVSAGFKARYPSPYQFLFHDIIWQLARWGRGFARGESIAPIFDVDADPRSVEPIYAALKTSPGYDNLVASVTFGSRRAFLPLQAADVIAGEMQRHWFDREYPDDPTTIFPVWRNLLVYATPMGNTGGMWGAETLARAAQAFDRTADPFNWEGPASSPQEPA
jgi:hypothetical protein